MQKWESGQIQSTLQIWQLLKKVGTPGDPHFSRSQKKEDHNKNAKVFRPMTVMICIIFTAKCRRKYYRPTHGELFSKSY